MGGAAAIQAVGPIRIDTIGHGLALEQSERPEGPWVVSYRQKVEIRDAAKRRLVRRGQTRDWNFTSWSPDSTALVVSEGTAARHTGEQWTPGTAFDLAYADDAFELSPERLLFTAREAADARVVPDRTLQGVRNHGVAFTWRGNAATVFVNANTHLPTLLEIVRNDDRFGVWGDVTERRWYSFWSMERGGVWYPRQVTVEWNGQPYSDETTLALAANAPLAEAELAIPADVRAAFAASLSRPIGLGSLRLDASKAIDLADGVVMLPGSWNVVLVRQDDGIIVIEAPISAQYSADVLAYAAQRFLGATVKAVITTSDAWPHIGGVREYIARGIPLYHLDLNGGILDRLAAAPRTISTDALARAPRPPQWHGVGGRTILGSGANRIELLPVRGELGERMMHVWFPALNLLYASDMIQRDRSGGFFWPGLLAEVEAVVTRERLASIERVSAMHATPLPWKDVTTALAALRAR